MLTEQVNGLRMDLGISLTHRFIHTNIHNADPYTVGFQNVMTLNEPSIVSGERTKPLKGNIQLVDDNLAWNYLEKQAKSVGGMQ